MIDDRLPLGRDGQLLCSFSKHEDEFWISLIEKAYMKVMGGYDFPGSSSVSLLFVSLIVIAEGMACNVVGVACNVVGVSLLSSEY